MAFCKVCNKDTKKYNAKIILSDFNPPRRVGVDLRYKTSVEVCPDCGVIVLAGAKNSYLRMLSEGYEKPSDADLKRIDIDSILDEMEPPYIHSTEKKIWVRKNIFSSSSLDDLSGGIAFDHANYYRLVHFFLLSQDERKQVFGPCRCPVIHINPGPSGYHAFFLDGRRRFSLLSYLGADKIPVSIDKDNLEILKDSELEYHLER